MLVLGGALGGFVWTPAFATSGASKIVAVDVNLRDSNILQLFESVDYTTETWAANQRFDQSSALILHAESFRILVGKEGGVIQLKEYLLSHKPVLVVGAEGSVFAEILPLPYKGEDNVFSGPGRGGASALAGVPLLGIPVAGLFIDPEGAHYTYGSIIPPVEPMGSGIDLSTAILWMADLPGWNGGSDSWIAFASTAEAVTYTEKSMRHVLRATYCYTSQPYGMICYEAGFYFANTYNTNEYDWWNVVVRARTVPGYRLWGSTNPWHTSKTWTTSDTDYYVPTNKLTDYAPQSTYSSTPATLYYKIGPTEGIDGAQNTIKSERRYAIDKLSVVQSSTPSQNDFNVRHDFDVNGAPANMEWSVMPGFSVRTSGDSNCVKLPYSNKAEYKDYASSTTWQLWINSWREACLPGYSNQFLEYRYERYGMPSGSDGYMYQEDTSNKYDAYWRGTQFSNACRDGPVETTTSATQVYGIGQGSWQELRAIKLTFSSEELGHWWYWPHCWVGIKYTDPALFIGSVPEHNFQGMMIYDQYGPVSDTGAGASQYGLYQALLLDLASYLSNGIFPSNAASMIYSSGSSSSYGVVTSDPYGDSTSGFGAHFPYYPWGTVRTSRDDYREMHEVSLWMQVRYGEVGPVVIPFSYSATVEATEFSDCPGCLGQVTTMVMKHKVAIPTNWGAGL